MNSGSFIGNYLGRFDFTFGTSEGAGTTEVQRSRSKVCSTQYLEYGAISLTPRHITGWFLFFSRRLERVTWYAIEPYQTPWRRNLCLQFFSNEDITIETAPYGTVRG